MPTTIYTIANTKGGTGKTTLAANFGAYLASQETRFGVFECVSYPEMDKYMSQTSYGLRPDPQ